MKRTMRVILKVDVEDLSKEDRARHAAEAGCAVSKLPGVKDARHQELSEVIVAAVENNSEAFGGSMIYANFLSATVISSKWEED